jgi:hypothetical protein
MPVAVRERILKIGKLDSNDSATLTQAVTTALTRFKP